MEASEARDIIDEAVERAEEAQDERAARDRAEEKRFRDRTSVLVGVFAVVLAVVHVAAAANERESLKSTIEASDTYAYMQAKIIRATVLTTGAREGPATERDALNAEAAKLRRPDRAGHGITQLQATGEQLREASERFATRGERYELAETALQVAIVLLSIALVARSRPIVTGAAALAAIGGAIAALTGLGAL